MKMATVEVVLVKERDPRYNYLKIHLEDRKAVNRLYDVIVTLPKGDLRHLAEKITAPSAWWFSSYFASKSFNAKFFLDYSFLFICCDGFIQGFFYGAFSKDYHDETKLHLPDDWQTIKPIEFDSFQGIRYLKVEQIPKITCLPPSEAENQVKLWKRGKRKNPKTGKWNVEVTYFRRTRFQA